MSDTDVTGVQLDANPEPAPVAARKAFKLRSLRPEYDQANHKLYVEYLRAELSKPARKGKEHDAGLGRDGLRPRNVALTGSYGSGKSSILSKIVDDFGSRVVSVSLSTLGSEEPQPDQDAAKDPLKTPPITNAIQKEIVKQLLYREKPSNVPGSRYRRIEGFRKGRAFAFSLLVAAGITALALLTGATSRVEKIFGNEVVPDVLIYAAVFILVLLLSQGLQLLFNNRVWIEKLTSGPASISLTNKSESFFDKYLDEIVYFFEANAYDIVVFEDLDRFNDPYIFEALRELNTLLNNSKQIDPKVITFVYAIKDSIFEQLGTLSVNGVLLTEDEIRQVAVTNRTKFFDVVIPVVPFISHRNARDLISKEMKSSGFEIDKALLDLVAKHMVDMRLIKNVHNEFGVFEQKILGPGHLAELKPQPLFAMVVYKNLNMADFEKVKEGTSDLDDVYADFRGLVNKQIASADSSIRLAQSRMRKLDSIDSRSKALGARLEEYLARLLGSAGQTIDKATLTLSTAIDLAELRKSTFWKGWLGDESLRLTIAYQTNANFAYYGVQTIAQSLTVSLEDLRVALGDPLKLEEWESADLKSLQATVEEKTLLRDFLKGSTMMQLAERPDLVLDTDHGSESFVAMTERHLGKGLALDLVRAGYIDRNFSLYVSLYYDDTVTAPARNYIIHSVESSTVDIHAEIGTGPQIEAMLDEVGDTIFGDRSIYNIQLLDHLLENEDPRLDRSMRLIAGAGAEEQEIRTAYLSGGSQPEAFVMRLAPVWSGVFDFLLTDESVAEGKKVGLIDAALGSISDKTSYKIGPVLGEFVRSHYRKIETLSGTKHPDSVEAVVAILRKANVRFESLEALSKELKPFAIEQSLYDLTEDNLAVALGGVKNLSLDNIRSASESVFRHVAENLTAYVEIQRRSKTTKHTIDDHKNFIPILNELADDQPDELMAVVKNAVPVVVNVITALNQKLWRTVAKTKHLKTNYANLTEYIDRLGGIDDDLAVTLNASTSVTEVDAADEPGKRALALAIVGSDAVASEKRVQLVKSLGLATPLLVSELDLADDDSALIGLLLKANLIPDSADSFAELGEVRWPVKGAFVQSSTSFASYVADIEFSQADFASLAKDPLVSDSIKKAIVLDLSKFTDSLSQGALDALALFSIDADLAVGPANLLAMASAGVASSSLVRLISFEIDSLVIGDLLAVLQAMPERYRRLATTGGHTKIPNSPEDLQLADHLVTVGQVSSRDPSPSGTLFRVNLKRAL
jgi:hypothetical protein